MLGRILTATGIAMALPLSLAACGGPADMPAPEPSFALFNERLEAGADCPELYGIRTAAGRRAVDLDAGTVEVLRQHQARQEAEREAAGELYDDRGRVFADATGGWASPQRLLKAVKDYGRRAGQPSMSVRSLRHFHASLLLQSGQNVVVVSKRLGLKSRRWFVNNR